MFEGKANAWIRHDELCEPERRQRSSYAKQVQAAQPSATPLIGVEPIVHQTICDGSAILDSAISPREERE
jgi:hypothetical protein